MSSPRHSILGVLVHATDYARATDAVIAAAKGKQAFAASALAVHGVMTGATDAEQRARLNSLDLVTPDGQPVRWALNSLYQTRLTDRVYGPFLTVAICERAAQEGLRVFFYGSDAATLNELSTRIRERFPALVVAGTRPSRFRRATSEEWQEDVAALRAASPDIVFCGLGCPRQEIWVYEMREYIQAPLIAVGAAFAFIAGRLSMAPPWMQRTGLEWLYRWSREPTRLWRRYFIYNPLFLFGILRQKLGRDYPSADSRAAMAAQRWS